MVDGGPPRCWWEPTNTMVVHHQPLRVYNEWNLNVVAHTSEAWPLTIIVPLGFEHLPSRLLLRDLRNQMIPD